MNRLEQQEARQPQVISAPPEEHSALVAAVLRKDRKATAEFVAVTLTISTGTSCPCAPQKLWERYAANCWRLYS